MSDELNTNEGLTRREALKKGARFGGALVWAVPVVQTVGMSPALAQRVSEGNCCLRIRFDEPTFVGYNSTSNLPEYQFVGRQTNCGALLIDDATFFIESSSDGGTNWGIVDFFNQGPIAVGTSDNLISVVRDFNADPGDELLFRAHGEFDCVEDDNNLWHTIPGGGTGTYIEYGPFVVPPAP